MKNKTKFKPKLNNIFIRNKIFTKVTSLYVYVVLVNTAECTKLMRLNLLEHPVSRNVSYIYYIVGLGLARSQCLVCCVLLPPPMTHLRPTERPILSIILTL